VLRRERARCQGAQVAIVTDDNLLEDTGIIHLLLEPGLNALKAILVNETLKPIPVLTHEQCILDTLPMRICNELEERQRLILINAPTLHGMFPRQIVEEQEQLTRASLYIIK